MPDVNNKPIEAPSFHISLNNWPLLVPVAYAEVCCLTYAKETNCLKLKKDDWNSLWKSAKALYYFYQNEVKPYAEKNKPELAGELQKQSELLNECFHDLKVLYQYASRNKLWVEN